MTDRTHRQLDDGKPAVGTETGGQRELLRKRERKPRAGRQWETDDAHRKLDKPVQRLFGRRPPRRGRQGLKIRGFKRRLAAPAQARTAGIGNTWIQAPIGGARPGADGRLPCAVPFRNGRNLSGFRVLPLYLRAGFAQNCERNAPANCRPARPLSLRVRFAQKCGGEPRAGSRPGVPCFFIPVFPQNCRTLLVGNCDFNGSRRRFDFQPKRLLVGNFGFVFFSGRVCIPILSFLTEIAGALRPADLRTSA